MAIATTNPATGELIRDFDALNDDVLEQKISDAYRAFLSYRATSFDERSGWLRRAAALLEERKRELGELITLEMGKPVRASVAEVEKCAWVCRYYADNAPGFLADRPAASDATRSFIRFQPLGPVLAVMPWNFPFWQVFRFAAPALMAGNVGLLKHASNVPQSALAIEQLIHDAGFPAAVFQTLLIGAEKVAAVVADERVKAATLTGSEPAGAGLASAAGKNLKKTLLELCGSDPFIVMPSVDIETAIETGVTARLLNNGQSCIAAKRFILHTKIADRFLESMTSRFKELKVGDPADESVDIGPLVNAAARDEIADQVRRCVEAGGRVLCGGNVEGLPLTTDAKLKNGFFYPPTIIADLPSDAAVAGEEFFGPVALTFRVDSRDEALRIANATSFGLGSSVWTAENEEIDFFVSGIEAGAVFVNGMVKSDPRLPFGGIKHSGYGRELGESGILEFVNAKTVWIR